MTTVNTKTLIAELSWIDRFVNKKATIPVLSTVLLKASGEFLKLSATDLETSGVTFCDVQGDASWSACVPVKALLKYLAKVEEKELTISGGESGLTVRHGDNEVTINGMGVESYPELPAQFEALGTLDGLGEVIPQVEVAMSQEESRFTLNGALLEVRDGAAAMVSTDGHRLSHVALPEASIDGSARLLIHKKALTELGRIVKESTVRLSRNDDFVSFAVGNRKIISRNMKGNFPDYERVLPKDFASTFDVEPKPLTKLVERIKTMADSRKPVAKWELLDGTLKLTAEISETSKATGSVKVGSDGAWNAGLDCDYALDFLKLANEATLSVKDPGSAAQFKSGHWTYIVMPCRI